VAKRTETKEKIIRSRNVVVSLIISLALLVFFQASSVIANYRLFDDYRHAWLGLQPNDGLVIAGEGTVIKMKPLER
jgi:hypothetical protein